MKTRIAFSLVLALLMVTAINMKAESQDSTAAGIIRNMEMPVEKVYLHLDRPDYSSGDDIWFKAYLVDGLTNKLTDNSNNLYVELISPESKIIKRLNIRLEKGTGAGDFHLTDSIASGNYLIRAYSNRMRNFGEDFFFKREIVIENQIGLKALNQPKQEESKEKVDVQFFPEGGPIIENVNTIIGFKAVNSSGYGCNVKGKVISSSGDSVASFYSTHLGMGSFHFISKKGLTYSAEGSTENGIPFKVKLPATLKTGYSMTVSDVDKDYFCVTINTNQETLDLSPLHELVITGTTHHSLCETSQLKVKDLSNPVYMPKNEFPDGITRITLMDITGKILGERIFFIHKKVNNRINIVADSKVVAPRQKTILHISVKDSSNHPVPAHLSVSVVDGSRLNNLEKKSSISSYLLLESEIRGHIEQPSYYFDITVEDRYIALDNLLLTQGWRNYVWDDISDSIVKFDYPAEKGLIISGRLRQILADKPIVDANISMILGNKLGNPLYRLTKTDSQGKYNFVGLNFKGPQNIVICATNKFGISNGWISLDSIYPAAAPISYNLTSKNEKTIRDFPELKEDSRHNGLSNYKEEIIFKYNNLRNFHLTDTIHLNEVAVKVKKFENEYDDGHQRMYGEPNFSLKVTDKMFGKKNILEAIQGRVAGLYITGDPILGYQFSLRGQKTAPPLFLIDGNEVDSAAFLALPLQAVDKIEVLKDGGKLAFYGLHGSFGVISVLTKRGEYEPAEPSLYSINQEIQGYFQARTFYTPKYDVKQPENEKPDLRTTIHWEPNVVTDTNGNATVSFFNADNKADIIIDVQGITQSGIPLTGKTSYTVK